jgi:hypothetical protein
MLDIVHDDGIRRNWYRFGGERDHGNFGVSKTGMKASNKIGQHNVQTKCLEAGSIEALHGRTLHAGPNHASLFYRSRILPELTKPLLIYSDYILVYCAVRPIA